MKFSTAILSLSLLVSSTQACNLDTIFSSPCSYDNLKASSGCTDSEFESLLGSDAYEVVNGLCSDAVHSNYEDFLPWSKVSSRGEQFTDTFFDGGSIFNTEDGIAKTGLTVANHPDTGRIKDIKEQLMTSHGITFPDYIKNFHQTDSCQSKAAMCCWVASRDTVDGELVGNTDVCYHDIEDSAGSAHVEKGSAIFGSLGEVKCDGFLWTEEDPYRGNLLFKVAMDQGLLSGHVRNIPGAPMCACLEQMPVVTHADCTDMTVDQQWEAMYDGTLETITIQKYGDPTITFNDCDGFSLSDYYHTKNSDTNYPIDEQFVDSCDDSIAQALEDVAFKKVDQDWIPVAGKGLLYHKSYTESAFNEAWELSNNQILRRRCLECERDHMDIYYRRFDENGLPDGFDLLHTVKDYWRSDEDGLTDNTFMEDFKLYSTYADAKNDVNAWQYCVFNNGFPGGCGSTSATSNQWNTFDPEQNHDGQQHVAFYIENGGSTY